MKGFKKFLGIILCIFAIGFIAATEQVEPSAQPFFIVLVFVCIFGAVMLLKKTKTQKQRLQEELEALRVQIAQANIELETKKKAIAKTTADSEAATRQCNTQKNKLQKLKELYEAVVYCVESTTTLTAEDAALYDGLCPSIILNLHSMESKELLKEFRANEKRIQETADAFESHHTNKTISALCRIMTIALRSELQNILYVLKHEKLDAAVDSVLEVTAKYYAIVSSVTGERKTAEALQEYIGKIEYLFINAVKIEYNYYVKKEQAKAEQAAIREQMRIEAEEKKRLEEERRKLVKEESKYQSEIDKITETIAETATDDEKEKLEARIAELQMLLVEMEQKKEEIINLQNGKAGTVYIISNLGSFGEDVFKIGMTRRLEPQDRVNELGDASVPFRFDVHSFIFSEDAPALETKLHTILNEKRVNKVNIRKEFFRVSLDELQELVYEIEPTASFTRTMAAEEYRQSMSTDEIYTTDYIPSEDDA